MYQDQTGYIWFGTEQGLYKYNGITFQNYTLPDTSRSNHVTTIFQDRQQSVWVGYNSGNLAKLKYDSLQVFEPREGTPVVPITGILQDPQGVMWFSTYGEGIYYYQNDRLYNLDVDDGLADNDIYDLTIDPSGRIWTGSDGGVSISTFTANGYNTKTLTTAHGLPDNIIRFIAPDPEGNMWIGTYDRGICRYDQDKDTITVSSKDWSFGRLNSMQWAPNGLWMATERTSIVHYDQRSGHWTDYSTGDPPIRGKVSDLLIDNHYNLWVAQNDNQIFRANLSLSFSKNDLHGITSVTHDNKGSIWIGNEGGLFQYQGDTLIQHLGGLSTDMLPINCIYSDSSGMIWLGTWNGLISYNPTLKSYHRYTEADGLVNNNVLSIAGLNQSIWIATLGGVSRFRPGKTGGRFENYQNKDLLGAGYVYSLYVDREGSVWFATDGQGLVRWRKGEWTTLIQQQPESSRVIYSITEDKQGHIWFSTPSNGVFRYDGDTFEHFGPDQGLRDSDISGLSIDRQGNLVIVHSLGIDLLDPTTGDVKTMGEESGIIDIETDLNSVAHSTHNVVWIGTKHNLISYDPGPTSLPLTPEATINKTSLFLEPFEITDGQSLRHNQNHLSFEYIGLWYQNPQDVVYEHQLQGFDLDWNPGKSQISTYPKLPPGDYVFKVRSSATGDFHNAKVATLEFTISAPFWQKTWFNVLSFIIGLLGIIAIIRYRENRLRSAERLKKELINTQLETLKSQVNPHFLFNSFNTLIGIIEDDREVAVDYVENLSDFFRATLEYRDKQLVTVEKELSLINHYFFLQQKRYGDNLVLKVDLNQETLKFFIPPLTLQVLIENCVKHNIISKDNPLKIKIYHKDQHLYVSNNKQPKPYTKASTGFGLSNIINRYKLLTKEPVIIMDQNDQNYAVGVPLLKNL